MHWKPNVDKLILAWLANRTPPSCICVNIVSMALAINPNTNVVKEAPCTKCIQQLHSILTILTKCLAGDVGGVSKQLMQTHNNATSHKGTEIVHLNTNVLTMNDQLRTICLVGDILPAEGSAECQSTALVNLFSESGQPLEGWQKETKVMYKHDPSSPALLAEIPKKQSLCVSRMLGAALSADNCSTTCKCTP